MFKQKPSFAPAYQPSVAQVCHPQGSGFYSLLATLLGCGFRVLWRLDRLIFGAVIQVRVWAFSNISKAV